MASTYSTLKIELIGTGDQNNTWGATTNTNLGTAIEEAITGMATANFTADSDLTITLTDSNASQVARNLVLNVTSGVSLTATRNLIVPTIEKAYYVFNNTTNGQSITVKTLAGAGVTIPNGGKSVVYVDGVNVVNPISNLTFYTQPKIAIAASTIDLSLGGYFTKTISGTTTFTVSNVPATGLGTNFIFEITNGGSATVNWWANTKWQYGVAPTLTTAGKDILSFYTHDGGTIWNGIVVAKDVK